MGVRDLAEDGDPLDGVTYTLSNGDRLGVLGADFNGVVDDRNGLDGSTLFCAEIK